MRAEEGFELLHEEVVAAPGGTDFFAQGVAVFVEGVGIDCKLKRFGDVGIRGLRDELRGPDAAENRSPRATGRDVAFDGDAREAHPAGEECHGESVVGERVEREVDVSEEVEVHGEGAAGMFCQALWRDTALFHPLFEGAARLSEVNEAGVRYLPENASPEIEHGIACFQEVVRGSKGER